MTTTHTVTIGRDSWQTADRERAGSVPQSVLTRLSTGRAVADLGCSLCGTERTLTMHVRGAGCVSTRGGEAEAFALAETRR